MTLRAATDDDSDALIRLVGDCFAEYPGCVLDLEVEEKELLTPATAYDRFWVIEEAGEVVGCVACDFRDGPVAILKKMYLRAGLRGSGRADALLQAVLERAREAGAGLVELWSDTRFTRAHRFYEREGFVPTGRTRDLNDPSHTTEFHFHREI